MKLGKLAPKAHPLTLDLAKFMVPGALPPPPQKTYWEYKIPPDSIGMYGNDEIGDCVLAMIAHSIMLKTAHTGTLVVPEVADIVQAYSDLSGYDPATGENDNGVAITDALEYWRTKGIAGHTILAWAKIDHTILLSQHLGIHIFGDTMSGVQLPMSAQTQFSAGQSWEVVEGTMIEGGHAILKTGYGVRGRNYQTWGKGDQKASDAWGHLYQDEEYVVITKDWLRNADGLAPNMLNLDKLNQALKDLAIV